MSKTLLRGTVFFLVATLVFWPFAQTWSAPGTAPSEMNLGLLAIGGTASASSYNKTFTANQAFDGVFFGETKASSYENGWVSRTGVGAWLQRDWPRQVELSGLTITRRSSRTVDLCGKAREVSIDFGGSKPVLITLADTHSPQYFQLNKNSARRLRLTVLSVEGTGCSGGAIGFSEVEIYGVAKDWTPLTMTTSAVSLPTATIPTRRLHFTYDSSLPADSQTYLTNVLAEVLPVMTEMLGSPLVEQTLLIRLNPTYGAFTYSAALSTLTISRLPNATLPITDPNNWDFNSNLTHELAHAYQAGYGFNAPGWFREGFAQAAADLVKNVLKERGLTMLQGNTFDEGQAIRTYDSMAAMGPEVLDATWEGNSRIIPYINAEGMWWLLMLSQSSPRPHGLYSEIDFLRRVETGLYQYTPDMSHAARRNFLANISPNLIDGQTASAWLMRQPIVQYAPFQDSLGFYPADCFCSQTVTAEAQHLIIFADGAFGSVSNIPIHVTLRDVAGNTHSEQTVPYVDHGFGFFYYTFPTLIGMLPAGRYDITVEATINGQSLRATQSIARGAFSLDSATGLSLTQRLAGPLKPMQVTSPLGTYQSSSPTTGRLSALPTTPQDVGLMINNRTKVEPVFVPAPYTRYINLP